MPVFRMVPTSDDGPNTFTTVLPHFSKIDEDISSPVTADFTRATAHGQKDRFGFAPAPPGLSSTSEVKLLIHHHMFDGAAASGTMLQKGRFLVNGVQVGTLFSIPIDNDDGPLTDEFPVSLVLSGADVDALQFELDSTTQSTLDWIGSTRWTVYTVNVDITYTKTGVEKVLAEEISSEKVITPSVP